MALSLIPHLLDNFGLFKCNLEPRGWETNLGPPEWQPSELHLQCFYVRSGQKMSNRSVSPNLLYFGKHQQLKLNERFL